MTKRETQALLRKNNITARVLTRWNRETNPRCKFLPGDSVIAKTRRTTSEPAAYKRLNGMEGTVIAVTTVDGFHICNENRKTSAYYVFDGKRVVRFRSNSLVAA